MIRLVQLRVLKISYDGDSIGRNIRIDIETLGKFVQINKRIRAGEVFEANTKVGQFETDRTLFKFETAITVTEKDLLFNDVGNIKKDLSVNTETTRPQIFDFEVKLRENRSILSIFWGKRTAIFKIILEATVLDKERYVPDLDESQGFLTVNMEDTNSTESLPAYLKIQIEHSDLQREYFTILEGPYRGKSASVGLPHNASSWFVTTKHEPMIRAKYSISKKIFTLKGKSYKADDDPNTPWRKGTYDIEIPDYPHELGRKYLNQSKRSLTWFRIGHSGERYLHTGSISTGCVTVVEVDHWTEIYNELIRARKGDFMSVGVLEVVD